MHESGTMDYDALIKRAQFIDRTAEIRTIFECGSLVEIIRAMKIYCSAFYGCMLWNLCGVAANQVYNSWNTAVKLAWGCPR